METLLDYMLQYLSDHMIFEIFHRLSNDSLLKLRYVRSDVEKYDEQNKEIERIVLDYARAYSQRSLFDLSVLNDWHDLAEACLPRMPINPFADGLSILLSYDKSRVEGFVEAMLTRLKNSTINPGDFDAYNGSRRVECAYGLVLRDCSDSLALPALPIDSVAKPIKYLEDFYKLADRYLPFSTSQSIIVFVHAYQCIEQFDVVNSIVTSDVFIERCVLTYLHKMASESTERKCLPNMIQTIRSHFDLVRKPARLESTIDDIRFIALAMFGRLTSDQVISIEASRFLLEELDKNYGWRDSQRLFPMRISFFYPILARLGLHGVKKALTKASSQTVEGLLIQLEANAPFILSSAFKSRRAARGESFYVFGAQPISIRYIAPTLGETLVQSMSMPKEHVQRVGEMFEEMFTIGPIDIKLSIINLFDIAVRMIRDKDDNRLFELILDRVNRNADRTLYREDYIVNVIRLDLLLDLPKAMERCLAIGFLDDRQPTIRVKNYINRLIARALFFPTALRILLSRTKCGIELEKSFTGTAINMTVHWYRTEARMTLFSEGHITIEQLARSIPDESARIVIEHYHRFTPGVITRIIDRSEEVLLDEAIGRFIGAPRLLSIILDNVIDRKALWAKYSRFIVDEFIQRPWLFFLLSPRSYDETIFDIYVNLHHAYYPDAGGFTSTMIEKMRTLPTLSNLIVHIDQPEVPGSEELFQYFEESLYEVLGSNVVHKFVVQLYLSRWFDQRMPLREYLSICRRMREVMSSGMVSFVERNGLIDIRAGMETSWPIETKRTISVMHRMIPSLSSSHRTKRISIFERYVAPFVRYNYMSFIRLVLKPMVYSTYGVKERLTLIQGKDLKHMLRLISIVQFYPDPDCKLRYEMDPDSIILNAIVDKL